MTSNPQTPEQYLETLPPERQEAVSRLRETVRTHLPEGFKESISAGMINYCVPHSTYPAGYHCNPKQPLPFISIASTKGHIALHHLGLYADPELLDWFTTEYGNHSRIKLDMGKGCVRFKKPEHIPYELVGKLAEKVTPEAWIAVYEKNFKR